MQYIIFGKCILKVYSDAHLKEAKQTYKSMKSVLELIFYDLI